MKAKFFARVSNFYFAIACVAFLFLAFKVKSAVQDISRVNDELAAQFGNMET